MASGGSEICDVALDKYEEAWEKAVQSWCDPETFGEGISRATGPLPRPANENTDPQSSDAPCASGVFLLGPFMLAFLGIRFRGKKGLRR